MKKILIFLNFILAYCSHGQSYVSIKIVDAVSQKPIVRAKVIDEDKIFYTNDDGNLLIPSDNEKLKISAPSFEEKFVQMPVSKIELNPKFNNIETVNIRRIDAKKIIEEVLKDYNKNYLISTTIYNGTYSSKIYVNDKIQSLLIADINLWTLNNKFDYKKKYDDFIQLNLNDLKCYKTITDGKNYPYSIKGQEKKEDIMSFVSRFFLYNQLSIMSYNTKNLKINGKIINEIGDIQEISFKSDFVEKEGLTFEGTFLYNKKQNVIIYLKVNQLQTITTRKYKNNFDEDISFNTSKYTIEYDMEEENKKYFPTRINMDYVGNIEYKNQKLSMYQTKQYIFRTHQESDKKGLVNRIDFNKKLSDNLPTNEIKESKILLSKEEQKFIDER
jgi:hypothetical protein